MNSWFGVSPISASHRFATPSPHRTGVPISDRFSIKRTSAPPRAAYFAAVLPVGPAPTTSTSIWWSIRVGPIPSDFMRIWESLFSNARCGGPQGPLSSGLRRSAVMLAPSRTAYVFVCVSTYTAHGAGNPEGPETRVLESRGLPKDWAASNGIRPGALVSLAIEDDGSLRVRVGPLEEYPVAAEATIDADEWSGPEALTRMITGNYIVGCNTIRLRSREELSPSQLQEIHEAVRGLTGLT